MNISIAKAKAMFLKLVKRAEIVAKRRGKMAARSMQSNAKPSSLNGAMGGKIRIADGFDELGPEWDEYVK